MRQRHNLILDAGHQLRNPIVGAAALLGVARTARSDYERQEIVEEAQLAMSRVRRLTCHLLRLETLEGRADAAMPVRVDLAAVVGKAAARVAPWVIAVDAELSLAVSKSWFRSLPPKGFLTRPWRTFSTTSV